MYSAWTVYKIIKNIREKSYFKKNYYNFSQLKIAYDIGKLWQPEEGVYNAAIEQNDKEMVFTTLGGYQYSIKMENLLRAVAIDSLSAFVLFLAFYPEEVPPPCNCNHTTTEVLTDRAPVETAGLNITDIE